MRGQDVVAGRILDADELILRRCLARVQDLDRILLAVGQVDEHRTEVPDALGVLQRLLDDLGVGLLQPALADIHDEPGMGAVDEVAPAKQRRPFVQEGRLQRAQIFRHAIDLLVEPGLHAVEDRAVLEPVLLHEAGQEDERPLLNASARIARQPGHRQTRGRHRVQAPEAGSRQVLPDAGPRTARHFP
ncbi:hypothetical protein D3C87_1592310 [compost metagenome]